jgi:hypothetical protein
MKSIHWLRLEGAAALVGAAFLYFKLGYSGAWFAGLFLLPDVAMAGYAAGPRTGATVCNLGHTYLFPVPLALAAWHWQAPAVLGGALIWIAHIGIDRALGYGLKRPTGFKDTHLSPLAPDAAR